MANKLNYFKKRLENTILAISTWINNWFNTLNMVIRYPMYQSIGTKNLIFLTIFLNYRYLSYTTTIYNNIPSNSILLSIYVMYIEVTSVVRLSKNKFVVMCICTSKIRGLPWKEKLLWFFYRVLTNGHIAHCRRDENVGHESHVNTFSKVFYLWLWN